MHLLHLCGEAVLPLPIIGLALAQALTLALIQFSHLLASTIHPHLPRHLEEDVAADDGDGGEDPRHGEALRVSGRVKEIADGEERTPDELSLIHI